MRLHERIDHYINLLDNTVLNNMFTNWFGSNIISNETIDQIIGNKKKIKKYWMSNHDMRLSQVLVNLNYIPNIPGVWYYEEDDIALINAGCNPNNVLFWGQNYDKDKNLLSKTKWVLIKDLSKDHIKNIIADCWNNLPEIYKQTFKEELKQCFRYFKLCLYTVHISSLR